MAAYTMLMAVSASAPYGMVRELAFMNSPMFCRTFIRRPLSKIGVCAHMSAASKMNANEITTASKSVLVGASTFDSTGVSKSVDPWYKDGLKFSCTMCGHCCSGQHGSVKFDEDEAAAMAAKLGVDIDTFYSKYTRKAQGKQARNTGALELKEVKAGKFGWDCIMLDRASHAGKAICSLYEARPMQCRTWPFWAEVVETPQTWAEAATECPGMNSGTLYAEEKISQDASLPYPL